MSWDIALCAVTRYYGISPEEIYKMEAHAFGRYLRNIPELERLFGGKAWRGETAREQAHDVMEILARKGVRIPE